MNWSRGLVFQLGNKNGLKQVTVTKVPGDCKWVQGNWFDDRSNRERNGWYIFTPNAQNLRNSRTNKLDIVS